MSYSITDVFYPEFQRAAQEIFGDNLSFAFIFGSFAKGYGAQMHDIDTFVCLHKKEMSSMHRYLSWLADQHNFFGLPIDHDYPAEIVDMFDLNRMLTRLPDVSLKLTGNSSEVFDYAVWAQVLSEEKKFDVGNRGVADFFKEECAPYPEKWHKQVIKLLQDNNDSRAELCRTKDPVYTLRKIVSFSQNGKSLYASPNLVVNAGNGASQNVAKLIL
jgi:predicted nucleotidyltransferase